MILENLYVGNKRASEINTDNISLIVNCTIDIPFQDNINDYIRIPIKDDPYESQKFITHIGKMKVLQHIHSYLLNKQKVLVHCSQGSQRSCAVVACYLVKYYDMTPIQAVNFIKSRRPIAFFGKVNFIEAINYFYVR